MSKKVSEVVTFLECAKLFITGAPKNLKLTLTSRMLSSRSQLIQTILKFENFILKLFPNAHNACLTAYCRCSLEV